MYPFKDCTSYLHMCYTIPFLLYSFERNRSSILAYFDSYKARKSRPQELNGERPDDTLLDLDAPI